MPRSSTLPPHLSLNSALVLLAPPSITLSIQTVRRTKTSNFQRWAAHINLIYPFLASPSTAHRTQLKWEIHARIRRAVAGTRPFQMSLKANRPRAFLHFKKTKAVFLDAVAPSETIRGLQKALQEEFSECNAAKRPFQPLLSVGQAKSHAQAQSLVDEIKESISQFRAEGSATESPQTSWDCLVDKVLLIERRSGRRCFFVVDAVELGK